MSILQGAANSAESTTTWPGNVPGLSLQTDAVIGELRSARLSASEVRRRLLHMLPGLLPVLLWFIPHTDPWGPVLANTVIAITAFVVGSALLHFGAFARAGEQSGRAAVLGYALPVLTAFTVCRGCEEVGVMTLAILAFGDGSATLFGISCGGPHLPWNSRKTWAGLAGFWVVGGCFATVMYWGEAHPGVSWETAIAVAGPTVLVAGLFETFPLRGNDNLCVGTTSAMVGFFMHRCLVG